MNRIDYPFILLIALCVIQLTFVIVEAIKWERKRKKILENIQRIKMNLQLISEGRIAECDTEEEYLNER